MTWRLLRYENRNADKSSPFRKSGRETGRNKTCDRLDAVAVVRKADGYLAALMRLRDE
jgi:hypothetical protein